MKFKTKLKDKRSVAENTFSFYFEKPQSFDFIPGQYIQMSLLNSVFDDDKGLTRDFSISSAPFEKELIITTRIRDSALKKSLSTLKKGDEVEIKGPHGKFLLEEGRAVFLAAGIGITAFRSMLAQLSYDTKNHDITLFYANKTEKSAVFLAELYGYEKKISGFTFVPIFTQQQNTPGEHEYLSETLFKKYLHNLDGIFYLVGNPEFVDSVQKTLEKANISNDRIRLDYFSGY